MWRVKTYTPKGTEQQLELSLAPEIAANLSARRCEAKVLFLWVFLNFF